MCDASGAYWAPKADLGHLGAGRGTECFAALAEQAKAEDWGHVGYLAWVVAEAALPPTGAWLYGPPTANAGQTVQDLLWLRPHECWVSGDAGQH